MNGTLNVIAKKDGWKWSEFIGNSRRAAQISTKSSHIDLAIIWVFFLVSNLKTNFKWRISNYLQFSECFYNHLKERQQKSIEIEMNDIELTVRTNIAQYPPLNTENHFELS